MPSGAMVGVRLSHRSPGAREREQKTKMDPTCGLAAASLSPEGAEQHLSRVCGFILGTPIVPK